MAYEHEFLGINSCIFVVGLLLCLLASAIIKRYSIWQLPESAAFILIGILGGCIAQLSDEQERTFVWFSPNLVFFILLPAIILDAGYTLKRKDFFDSLGPVLLLATVGTIINNLAFGYILYLCSQAGWIQLSLLECLLFGAVISATDPVATLSLMGSKLTNTDPMLYSIVMGESVLNDAVAVVLYKAFASSVVLSDDSSSFTSTEFAFVDLILCMLQFVGVSVGSVVVGVGVGLLCSFLCKRVNLARFPISELTLVTLFAYLSYFMAEMIYLSGIMSLFFCSICLNHYNFYNLTPIAQVSIQESFHSNAVIAEVALYALLGVTMGLSLRGSFVQYSFGLATLTVVIALFARALHVFPLCHLSNRSRSPALQVTRPMQVSLWFAGLRGGVSFALSLGFPGPNRGLVVGATMILVLVTTFVQGGLTLPLLRITGMTQETRAGVEQQQEALEQKEETEDDGPLTVDSQHATDGNDDINPFDTQPEEQNSGSSDATLPASSPSTTPPAAHSHIGPPPSGLTLKFIQLDENHLRRLFGDRFTQRDVTGEDHFIGGEPAPSELVGIDGILHTPKRLRQRNPSVQLIAERAAALSPGTPRDNRERRSFHQRLCQLLADRSCVLCICVCVCVHVRSTFAFLIFGIFGSTTSSFLLSKLMILPIGTALPDS